MRQRRFFTGEKSLIFLPKGLQSAARIILPQAAKFHTGSLRGVFPHAHVAVKNDPNFLTPAGGKLCEVFLGGRPYTFIVNVIAKPARTLAVAIRNSRPSHINFASPGNLTPEAISYE